MATLESLVPRIVSSSASLLMNKYFPQRTFRLIIHEMLDGRDLGRLDIAVGRKRKYLHSMIENVTWERFIHFRCWSPHLFQWMKRRNIAMPKELAESLAVHEINDDESIARDAVGRFPVFFDAKNLVIPMMRTIY